MDRTRISNVKNISGKTGELVINSYIETVISS
jgi:hypothetical protein